MADTPMQPEGAPYDVNTLSADTLTTPERANIIAWMLLMKAKHTNMSFTMPKQGATAQQVLDTYRIVLELVTANKNMPGLQDPGTAVKDAIGETSIGKFLGMLTKTSTWVRVGEFTVGLILVGVAVDVALKGNSSYDKARSAASNPFKAAPIKAAPIKAAPKPATPKPAYPKPPPAPWGVV